MFHLKYTYFVLQAELRYNARRLIGSPIMDIVIRYYRSHLPKLYTKTIGLCYNFPIINTFIVAQNDPTKRRPLYF